MAGKYNRKDHLYQKAKDEGQRSRAAYKLKELNQRFKLIQSGDYVLDLGAWPGGWTSVAAEMVGPNGLVVGVDLVKIDPLESENVNLIQGDASDPKVSEEISNLAPDKFNCLISDMSPKITGIREVDQAQIKNIANIALNAAKTHLRAGGILVIKVFKGNSTELFFKEFKQYFKKTQRCELETSRTTSNEFYLVGIDFKI